MPKSPDVTICEMAPRDGLQALDLEGRIPAEVRIRLVAALQRAGLPYIEVGSFVSPRRMPSMRDTVEVAAGLSPYNGELAALVPNKKYYARFHKASNLNTVALFVSASESYSLKNTRMTTEEALTAAAEVAAAASADGYGVRAHLSGAFRDLTETDNPADAVEVARICRRLQEMQCKVVALADTDGRAGPDDMHRVIQFVAETVGLDGIGVHLHDRNDDGIDKALAAYEAGIRVFDAAVGGIGGNRTVGLAAGNLATEALVQMLERLGVETGVDVNALTDAGRIIFNMAEEIGADPPPSQLLRERLGIR